MLRKDWTEHALQQLIGQSESIRREFKSGRLFDDSKENDWKKTLSKAVSAFANTEGGELFLGMAEEKRGESSVAAKIDGVPASITRDRLKDILESNVSPHLPGLLLDRVRLSALPERVAYVVTVPQGSTAYQASDLFYYGRSTGKSAALHDREIRLRMNRGRLPRARITLVVDRVKLAADRVVALREQMRDAVEAAKVDPAAALDKHPELWGLATAKFEADEITLRLDLVNEGELTIEKPIVELEFRENGVVKPSLLPRRSDLADAVIYPEDRYEIASWSFRLKPEQMLAADQFAVFWKIYLHNAPATTGTIDVVTELRQRLTERQV